MICSCLKKLNRWDNLLLVGRCSVNCVRESGGVWGGDLWRGMLICEKDYRFFRGCGLEGVRRRMGGLGF